MCNAGNTTFAWQILTKSIVCRLFHSLFLFWTWKPVLQCCLRRAHLAWENPRGSGFWDGEGMGEMEVGRSVYEQPGSRVDWILSQQGGFQASKRDQKGDCAITALFVYMYIMIACNCLNDCQSVYARV